MRTDDPAAVVRRSGGIADAATLRMVCSAKRIKRSVDAGEVVLLRRGRYGLPAVDDASVVAVALSGVVSHLSAAMHWGWKVKTPPDKPHVTLRRGRRLTENQRDSATIHWTMPAPQELRTGQRGCQVTSPVQTVVDCARALPFDEALAVADSALRSGRVTRAQLMAAAATCPRTGRAKALRVAKGADKRAANPFESCLRAICLEVVGLQVEPQVRIGAYRVDLCDRRLRIVIEADSWEFHAGPDEFAADVRRYTALVRVGARVLRFSYRDVMGDPNYVAAVLRDVVVLAGAERLARLHGASTTHSSSLQQAS